MQQIFKAIDWLQVPDTTWLSPFLNPKDVNSGLDSELLGAFSLAMGMIRPGQPSTVHVHPLSTQVTMVLEGTLDIRMRDPSREPYTVRLGPDQAALVEPGTFLQLVNPGDATSRMLYVVGPAYVFEQRGEEVVYDDSIALSQEWEEIADGGSGPGSQMSTRCEPRATPRWRGSTALRARARSRRTSSGRSPTASTRPGA
jgi:mannose-6-phosphate isomerase-like protein (cupin superfamily)